MTVTKQTFNKILNAEMPDTCQIKDYLDDIKFNKEDLVNLGIDINGYEISQIRSEIYDDFNYLLINTIIKAYLDAEGSQQVS